MPAYTMRNIETEEVKEMILSFSERDEFLKNNPEWEQCLSTPPLVSGVTSNLRRAGDGWKDVLNQIKKGSARDNTIKT